MIKVKEPNPIYLEHEGAAHAVLLLHSFTGTVRDVKLLATKLHKAGYTCYVPSYKGHGKMLEDLMAYTIEDWWQDAQDGYAFLQDKGYDKITVLGVSLGGLLSLKFSETKSVHSVIAMSVPYKKDDAGLAMRLEAYGRRMGDILGLDQVEIERQVADIDSYEAGFETFKNVVDNIMIQLPSIQAPIAIKYGKLDEPAYAKSAHYIYEHIAHQHKSLQGYADSKHLMTQGSGREAVEQDILHFLAELQ
ncbi:alpha/beta hydrolase [Staphylococcus arlettae]|uniref:alpha/beta hydrolase n=1 Tax=Staphylococcus arlettae TaxID=29378 RepID=UPI0002822D6E|nr:alpha/beta fold hydrolase [Staphylococcus arlettae]EJY95772.1 carboxylesterase [Staphylococcus arlettae CVD059]MDT3893251.1 alpha/beta fold hydrolase [Staphylococcus arlettae]